MVMPVAIATLTLVHPTGHLLHIEDVVIFPIGLVPNAWGLWNVLYLWLRRTREIQPGLFGAALVFLIVPAAWGIQLAVGKMLWTPGLFAIGFPIAFIAYYLVWKNVVARLNGILGIG
jgi:hypothetical protein